MSEPVKIYKTNGDLVPFEKNKVKESLLRSGTKEKLAQEIADEVAEKVEEKMSTTDIYNMAYDLLEKHKENVTAGRYSLKRAIMMLGPTGFPFENFIGELMEERGYNVMVGSQMEGICVSHEVDVVAKKKEEHRLMECKFHNEPGIKTGVKIPMYINSRFEDIEQKNKAEGKKKPVHEFWVVTNTRFTDEAIEYGECRDMNMLGWRYPADGGLEDWVEAQGLYPVTCLTSISKEEKTKLLKREIVLCRDLLDQREMLSIIGLNQEQIDSTLQEAEQLCNK